MCWWSCESWHKMLSDATGLLFRTIAGFLLKFMSDILFESCLNESSAAWCLTHCSNRCSRSALILWAEEVLMTQWLLISSLLLLSRCAPDFFIFLSFFQEPVVETLDAVNTCPCEACVSSLIYLFILTSWFSNICCPPADEWLACGQLTPAWRHIHYERFKNV